MTQQIKMMPQSDDLNSIPGTPPKKKENKFLSSELHMCFMYTHTNLNMFTNNILFSIKIKFLEPKLTNYVQYFMPKTT